MKDAITLKTYRLNTLNRRLNFVVCGRSRVALARDSAGSDGRIHEQGAKATLLRRGALSSYWFKRHLSAVKRSEKLAVGWATHD